MNGNMKPIGFSNIHEADQLRKFFLTGIFSGDFVSLPIVTGNKKGRC
jgi:hypothetical protein